MTLSDLWPYIKVTILFNVK